MDSGSHAKRILNHCFTESSVETPQKVLVLAYSWRSAAVWERGTCLCPEVVDCYHRSLTKPRLLCFYLKRSLKFFTVWSIVWNVWEINPPSAGSSTALVRIIFILKLICQWKISTRCSHSNCCPKTDLMCLSIVGKFDIVMLWRKRIKEKTGLGKLEGALDWG